MTWALLSIIPQYNTVDHTMPSSNQWQYMKVYTDTAVVSCKFCFPTAVDKHTLRHTRGEMKRKNRNHTLNPASINRWIAFVSPCVSADLETSALSHLCLSFLIRSNRLVPGVNHSCLANTMHGSHDGCHCPDCFTKWHHRNFGFQIQRELKPEVFLWDKWLLSREALINPENVEPCQRTQQSTWLGLELFFLL